MEPMEDPDIREWVTGVGGDVDYLDFLAQRVGIAEWSAISRVFMPRFVEVGDCVLWDRAYEPGNFARWQTELPGNLTAVEAVLNQFRLWQYLDFDSDAQATALAEDIAFCWRGALARQFPAREFDVSVVATEDGPVVRCTTRRPVAESGT
ncbi:hypothetical protein [Streptomyces sp. NPDC051211]|uniref:hypothetical protein n=1 Tax=Streptomyces sp. NPDC051211 TaxID=3154643 RepID=UPI00344BE90C